MSLINVRDAAYPPGMSTLPASVKAVCGYVGQKGYTPHIWTLNEVQAVRDSGRQWWPIIVPPQGVMSAATGTAAAAEMLAALPAYRVAKDCPMFFDVEYNAWEASPGGAMAAVNAWKAAMRAGGYTRPFAYVPHKAGFDWIAQYVQPYTVPASLPPGVIGVQFANPAISGTSWDHSVFDSSLLNTPTTPAPPAPPKPQEIFDMSKYVIQYTRDGDGNYYEANLLAGTYWHIPSPDDIQQRQKALDAAGIQYAPGHVDVTDMSAYGVQVGK